MSDRLLVALLLYFLSPVVWADSLQFSEPWIRATPPGAVTAAAYLNINNTGGPDRLLGIEWNQDTPVEIHTVENQSGMMRMRRLEYLDIPAGQLTRLAPGGQHIMFVRLQQGFAAGESVSLILIFEQAGRREIDFPVIDARGL
jgi:periplasmic copper chaperone A